MQVFGPPPKDHATSALPQHGFARSTRWEYMGKSSAESSVLSKNRGDDSVKVDFGLSDANLSDEFKKAWSYKFSLVYSVTLGKDGLQTMLHVRNDGDKSFDFQTLLHSYFTVAVSAEGDDTSSLPILTSYAQDISKTQVNGLGSETYVDKLLNATEHQQTSASLSITGEVDRVYKGLKLDTTSIVEDGKPSLDVTRDNLKDLVVWNAWIEKAKSMGDFEPKDGYKKYICVEVGSVDGFEVLSAGDTWEGGQILKAH